MSKNDAPKLSQKHFDALDSAIERSQCVADGVAIAELPAILRAYQEHDGVIEVDGVRYGESMIRASQERIAELEKAAGYMLQCAPGSGWADPNAASQMRKTLHAAPSADTRNIRATELIEPPRAPIDHEYAGKYHKACIHCGQIYELSDDICNAAPQPAAVPWELFPGWLLDHHEGDVITEESLQFWLSEMLAAYKKDKSEPQFHTSSPDHGEGL